MGTICFVILNYKTWREAAACAESILKTQQGQDIRIVLVDNGSGNGSEESLREEFAGEKRVHVIASEKNLGFARGNNLGIRYARSHFEPDFIVAANSDIIFEQEDYCEKLREIYKEERFDILGGDIVDASRTRHFNPVARNRQYTLNYMRKQILVSWAKCKMFQLIKLFHLKKAIVGHYGVVSDETGRDVKDGSKNLTTREEDGKSVSADSRVDELVAELQILPDKIAKTLTDNERIQWFASKYASAKDAFFIGRGLDYAVALEGSLKFKEISYIHSEAFAAGEMKHGPISLIEKNMLVVGVLTQPDLFEKSVSNMVEVKSRGAFLMGLTTYGNYSIEDTAGFTVYVPKTDPHFATSLSVIPLQLLAYYVSCAKGLDVDKPRNLAKSVTVE